MQIHASNHATTPDHYSAYALSDPKDRCFRIDCDQRHNDRCSQCEVLKAAVKEVGEAITAAPLLEDERDDLQFSFQQARQAIESGTSLGPCNKIKHEQRFWMV